jgi:PhzF family phenazine biosynthesis protein
VTVDLPFSQVDVFSPAPGLGNALAVVGGAEALSDEQLRTFARWTNLSETTFLLPPTNPAADYRVRILTPSAELPFAGHPTLGTCSVWLARGGQPKSEEVVQECGIGLVRIRRDGGRLAFAAPPLRNPRPLDETTLAQVCLGLGIKRDAVLGARHLENGPDWVTVRLRSRQEVLALRPDYAAVGGLDIGVLAPWDPAVDGTDAQFEVRAIVGQPPSEDPVTGSLNAGLALWLMEEGIAPEHYVAAQGAALGRRGRVYVDRVGDTTWIGGEVRSLIEGTVTL